MSLSSTNRARSARVFDRLKCGSSHQCSISKPAIGARPLPERRDVMRDGEMARPLTAPYPSPRTPSTDTDRRGKKARPGRGAPPGAGLETRDARGMRLAIPGLVMRRILKLSLIHISEPTRL